MKLSRTCIALALALVPATVSCQSTPRSTLPAAPQVRNVTASEAAALVAEGKAVLVDVREAGEIAGGMAEPARWMPTSRIGGEEWRPFVATIPVDREAIFYCVSGSRSQRAALSIAEIGYRAANMGGFDSWQRAGLPVKKPVKPEVGK